MQVGRIELANVTHESHTSLERQKIAVLPVLEPPPVDARPRYKDGVNPSVLLLHETIYRALQMVANAYKKFIDDEKKRSISNSHE